MEPNLPGVKYWKLEQKILSNILKSSEVELLKIKERLISLCTDYSLLMTIALILMTVEQDQNLNCDKIKNSFHMFSDTVMIYSYFNYCLIDPLKLVQNNVYRC